LNAHPVRRRLVWLKLNLAALLVAEVWTLLLAVAQGRFALLYGSLRQARLVWAYIIIAALFVACVAVSFRKWRVSPLRIWMLPLALLLATYATLVAVDPGAKWGGGKDMPHPEEYYY